MFTVLYKYIFSVNKIILHRDKKSNYFLMFQCLTFRLHCVLHYLFICKYMRKYIIFSTFCLYLFKHQSSLCTRSVISLGYEILIDVWERILLNCSLHVKIFKSQKIVLLISVHEGFPRNMGVLASLEGMMVQSK